MFALHIHMYTCLYTYKDLYIQTCITFFLVKRAGKFFSLVVKLENMIQFVCF